MELSNLSKAVKGKYDDNMFPESVRKNLLAFFNWNKEQLDMANRKRRPEDYLPKWKSDSIVMELPDRLVLEFNQAVQEHCNSIMQTKIAHFSEMYKLEEMK